MRDRWIDPPDGCCYKSTFKAMLYPADYLHIYLAATTLHLLAGVRLGGQCVSFFLTYLWSSSLAPSHHLLRNPKTCHRCEGLVMTDERYLSVLLTGR